jgi:PPP family 3-phenylpropionic acid transporter
MTLRYPTTPVPSKWSAVFYAAYFAVLGVVVPFLGPYLQSRGIAAVGIGCITAAFSLAKLVYTPILGTAVDRGFWIRGLLTLHVGLSLVCAFVLYALADDPWLLMLAFFLIGLGYGTVLPLVEATVLENIRGRRYGWLRLWGSIGFVVAASISIPAVTRDLVRAFPVLLGLTLAVLWMSCLPFEKAARPARRVGRGKLPGAEWGLLGLLTLNQVIHGPYYAFFSIHLRESGFSSVMVAVMWSLGVVAELGAFFAGPWLERRFGLRRLLGLALLVAPLRWLLLAQPLSTVILVVAQLGHAATYAVIHLAGIQLVQANAPSGSTRYAQALYGGLCFGLGLVAGSALAGPLYDRFGGSGSFLAAAIAAACLFLAWAPLSRRLKEE